MIVINEAILIIALLIALTSIGFSLYVKKNTEKNSDHRVVDEKLFKEPYMLDVESSVIAQTNIINQEGVPLTFYYAGAEEYKMNTETGFVDILKNDKVVASLLIKDTQLITVNDTPGGVSNGKDNK